MHSLPLEIWQLIFANFTVDLVPEIWDDGIGPDLGTKVPSGRGGGERNGNRDNNASTKTNRKYYSSNNSNSGLPCLKTLASLCRVCHTFRDIAQPLLYRSIYQEDAVAGRRGWHTNLVRTLTGTHNHDTDGGGGGGGGCNDRGMNGCVDQGDTSVGQHVRAISLGARVYELFMDLDETLEAALPSLRLPYICREHVLSGGGDYAEDHRSRLYMACLACTPNVEYVECHVRDSRQLFAAFIAGATSSPDIRALIQEERQDADYTVRSEPWKYRDIPPATENGGDWEFSLRHLKALRLQHDHDTIPARVTDIEPLLYHTSLRTLQLSGWDWTNRESRAMLRCKQNKHLEALELDDCVTDEQAIEDILARFKGLRTLVVRLVRDSWGRNDMTWWELWLPELTQTLVSLGGNLVRLDLDTDECCGNVVGRLGSLRGMRSLRHLKIAYRDLLSPRDPSNDFSEAPDVPTENLVLADLLPENLETLCMYKSAYNETARNHYHALLVAAGQARLLSLESLTVQCRAGESEKMEDPLVFSKDVPGWAHSSMEERRTSKLKGKGPTRSWKYRVSTMQRVAVAGANTYLRREL